jgi:predicted PurR-regulated permease PerM
MATHAERAPRSSATPLLALVVATAVLYLAREVIIPLALAVLFAFVLAPLVRRLEGWRFGRVPSVLVAVLLGMAVVGAVGWVAVTQAVSLAAKLPEYRENISRKLKDLRSPPKEGELAKAAKAIKELESQAHEKGKPPPKPAPQAAPVTLPTTPLELITRAGLPAALVLAALAVVLVVSMLILLNRYDLRDRVIRLVGEGRIHVTTQALEEASGRVSRYLLSLLMVNVTFGALLGIAFYFIGLPNALLWGLLAAVLRFVPYIGAPAAAVMPVALAFAISDGWSLVAWTIAAIGAVDVVIAYVVEPVLYGARTGLTPIAVVLGSVYWTWLWGPFGLLLATPITVCIAVVTRYFPNFRFLSVFLSDQPVLPPPVRLYQRLVSLEYDEAYDVAEAFAREHGLASLYESMLLPALALAKRDRWRNALEIDRGEFVYASLLRIAEEVADDEMAREPQEKGAAASIPAPQVCIVPAHDEADYIAAVMLARLLAPEHFRTLLIPQDILAAEVIERIEKLDPKVVCISAVPPQAASNAAYIAKRVQQRLPEKKVVVGLWCADENVETTARRLRNAGADEVATTLPQAIEKLRLVAPPGVA